VTEKMDWHEWHGQYDDPTSSLSRRLAAVREQLARVLESRAGRMTRLVSICAGDGRDTLPVLAHGHRDVSAVLVELDAALADAARTEATRLELPAVEVRTADASQIDTFLGVGPADVFLACGVFGNISDADLAATIGALPQLLAADARVIWTRGRPTGDPTDYADDPAELVREVFARHAYVEEAFVRPGDADFRVGVHRFVGTPEPRAAGATMFSFVR
jgi:hypothetical protein